MTTHQELASKVLIRLSILVTVGGVVLLQFPITRATIEAIALIVALWGVAGLGRPALRFGAAGALLTWIIYVSLVDSDAGGTNELLGGIAAPILGPVVGLLALSARKLIRQGRHAQQ